VQRSAEKRCFARFYSAFLSPSVLLRFIGSLIPGRCNAKGKRRNTNEDKVATESNQL
jgi:hypothetical protein